MRLRRSCLQLGVLTLLALAQPAFAGPPNGLGLVRVLAANAESVLAPKSGKIGALVAIPSNHTAAELGIVEVVPGIGRMRRSAADLLAFGLAHPDVHVEVMPPLHALLANAQLITHAALARATRGADGRGAAVGIVDTGLDVTLPDFRDPTTNASRVAWMLDLSMAPLGIHADLEKKFGIQDGNGNVVKGAVLTGADIDTLIAQANPVPTDPNGHGTHVASIAAGNGGGTPYIGIAPSASLVIVRASRDASGSFENDDIILGASFVFDRASDLKMPLSANFSIGTDFGPHDGNSLWERTLASFGGPSQPGRVIVAAAGNSGSIVDDPIHEGVAVTGARMTVPIVAKATSGSVQVWVALRAGANLRIGLDGPDGTWVSPISDEHEQAHNSGGPNGYTSGVIYGTTVANTPVPKGSHGAIVVWSGNWPAGRYAVTLEGHGYADLYLEAGGSAAQNVGFEHAVRDATVTLPATNTGILAVGCTIDSPSWTSARGEKIGITEPLLDAYGGLAQNPSQRQAVQPGEICYFSSAGPTLTGAPKPDILAPGGIVIGAMSQQALPGTPNSIFTTECPPSKTACGAGCPNGMTCGSSGLCFDPSCAVVEKYHAVASGTSMSSPMVTGVAALLLQQNPTLTQDVIQALLQAGAHAPRGPTPFYDQSGPGELDAIGALDALAQLSQTNVVVPDGSKSWMTLSEDFAVADGSTPLTATLELRAASGERATLFDSSRLTPVAVLGGAQLETAIVRGLAPGLFTFTVSVPPGHTNGSITLGALFDGAPIVGLVTIPVALDSWTAGYAPGIQGGCSASQSHTSDVVPLLFGLGLLALRRRSR